MSISELTQRREAAQQQWQARQNADLLITVGMGTCGLAAGAQETLAAVQRELAGRGLSAQISPARQSISPSRASNCASCSATGVWSTRKAR